MFFVYLSALILGFMLLGMVVPLLEKMWAPIRVTLLRWTLLYAIAVGALGILSMWFFNMDVTFVVDQDGLFFGYESGEPLPFLFIAAAALPMTLVVGFMERSFRMKRQVQDGDAGGFIQPA